MVTNINMAGMRKESKKTATGSERAESASPLFDLQRAMKCWMDGDWPLLAVQHASLIAPDGDRGLTAAYVVAAHHFCDDNDAARSWAGVALEWGCPLAYLAKVLTASMYITLARMASLAGDVDRARAHMSKTADPISGEKSKAFADARLSKELAALGLLQTSVMVVGEDLQQIIDQPLRTVARHRINILKSELIQIRQQLALHQSRGQLGGGRDGAADNSSDQESIKQHSMSQLGQDLWVLERTGYKRNGFFVEFGATDGVLLSNTFLLEKMFGWTGLLSEPNPEYFADLKKHRSAKALDACIAGKSGEIVDFVLADEFGGIKDYISDDRHASRRESYAQLPENVLRLETVSLDEFLRQNEAPFQIDYISVDSEGSELDILRAFPFEKWDVSLWTVEHNFTKNRDEIFKIMTSNGYLRKEVRFDDWYYKVNV